MFRRIKLLPMFFPFMHFALLSPLYSSTEFCSSSLDHMYPYGTCWLPSPISHTWSAYIRMCLSFELYYYPKRKVLFISQVLISLPGRLILFQLFYFFNLASISEILCSLLSLWLTGSKLSDLFKLYSRLWTLWRWSQCFPYNTSPILSWGIFDCCI